LTDSSFTVRRFSDDFAKILRSRILSGDLRSGTRLNEVHLAAEYGISRSPIREALQALSGEGLVTFVAGKGAFVDGLTATEVNELGAIRAAVESHAARLVAERATADDIATLELSTEIMDQSAPDAERLEFHTLILQLSGNRRLEELGNSVAARLRLARSHSATRPGRVAEAIEEHRAIVEAIRRGDPLAAGESMRDHVQRATASAAEMTATE
jgi:DNA-binding GntR family transcriptional regulator